ncbi:MAG: DUF4290 domain-containing protein [Prevotellaceae bacterium]|nr:DUF4290 domain-containing protein [Prevotellaceae bacterium]
MDLYNTQLNPLVLPEYGRHIQRMVEHLRDIPDREKRNEQARAVIGVMGNLFPHLRDINDFKHKLWDHLFLIANFDIDIDSPFSRPTPATFEGRPRQVPYSSPDTIRVKHYGRGVQDMTDGIATLPEGETRELAAVALANHMKRAYLTWNKDSVTDDVIYGDVARMSRGQVCIDSDVQLSVSNFSETPVNTSNSAAPSNNGLKKRRGKNCKQRGLPPRKNAHQQM